MMRASDYPRVCANCKWWAPEWEVDESHGVYGACRRYPPTLAGGARFPNTFKNMWCGEFAIMQHPRVGDGEAA